MKIQEIAAEAKKASAIIAKANENQKNSALQSIADLIRIRQGEILVANLRDIEEAKVQGLSSSMIERLSLQNKLSGIISDIESVIKLKDPVGEVLEEYLHNQLTIKRTRIPIGVLGVIYESRPNVTIDVSCLAIKSGNCAILRGGSEAIHTNKIIVGIIQDALCKTELPKTAIQLLESTDRSEVLKMLKLHHFIDLIIPRGGAGLHQFCRENSSIPVITGGIGICHLFVDETAKIEKTLPLIANAKTQRPTVCNALDTLLVHEKIAFTFIPKLITQLSKLGVEFRLCPTSFNIVKKEQLEASYQLAKEEDWDTEWLSLVLGIKVVSDLNRAIEHIVKHSTKHSDGIITENPAHAESFCRAIDSAAVYVNASTRFTDGSQLGLGSEVAISTQKLHARGPMGLKELTTYKWLIHGDYSVRT